MKFITPVFTVIITLSIFAFFMDEGIDENEAAVAFCRDEPETAAAILDFWAEQDVILGIAEAEVEIDEKRWEEIEPDVQLMIGVSAWCEYAVPAYGSNSVVLKGFWQGLTVASIINGHYVDGIIE